MADVIVMAGMLICLISPLLFSVNKMASYGVVAIGLMVCMIPLFLKRKTKRSVNW